MDLVVEVIKDLYYSTTDGRTCVRINGMWTLKSSQGLFIDEDWNRNDLFERNNLTTERSWDKT